MDKNKCPVCGNEEGIYIRASGSEWAGLVSCIGRITLISCSECGCVYTSVYDRKTYKVYKNEQVKDNG